MLLGSAKDEHYSCFHFPTAEFLPSFFQLKVSKFLNEFMKLSFLPKYEWKISALCSEGRNLDNFLFIFWEKRWLHKFILKMSDLSSGLKKVSKYYKLIIFIKFLLFNLYYRFYYTTAYMYCHVELFHKSENTENH